MKIHAFESLIIIIMISMVTENSYIHTYYRIAGKFRGRKFRDFVQN